MQIVIFFLLVLIAVGCKRPSSNYSIPQVLESQLQDSTQKLGNVLPEPTQTHSKIYNSLFEKDSVVIRVGDYDYNRIVLHKNDLRLLEKQYPSFFEDYVYDPDQAYCSRKRIDNEDSTYSNFGSEAGQDSYFILYGYFLKIKNGDTKFRKQREKLSNIYETLNSIDANIENGGTYFGHMSKRILGYAEYGIYLLADEDYNARFKKDYDIKNQKAIFIKSMQQYIIDESNNWDYCAEEFKREKIKKLLKEVDVLDKEIDNYFYLSMASKFEYEKYR